jgi:hypothetical protein
MEYLKKTLLSSWPAQVITKAVKPLSHPIPKKDSGPVPPDTSNLDLMGRMKADAAYKKKMIEYLDGQ